MNSGDGKEGISASALLQVMLLVLLIGSSAAVTPVPRQPAETTAAEAVAPLSEVGLLLRGNGEVALYELGRREP